MASRTADSESEESVSAPALQLLLPRYDSEKHGPYVRMLRAAIDGRHAKNIALAGQYSSGKSSVLSGLVEELRETNLKPITLSLSTIDAEAARLRASGSPPDAGAGSRAGIPPVTSLIQNEIVKQLVYRKRPSAVPDSRFRRAEAFSTGRAVVLSLLVAIAVALAFLLWPEANHLVKGILLAVAAGVATFVVQRRFRGRVVLQQLTAGPATLALDTTRSYFDEYLDELIYFFDVSRCKVVIFEDIDRFNDSHIFETLRELNTLLNSAEQLSDEKTGPLRFIYATRDSIFEVANEEAKDQAPGAPNSPAADRTKFFDVVVPLVPFVTHRTSRDHFMSLLAGSQIAPRVIGLVSKYVTDMRLIVNICNEFEVFKSVVLDGTGLGHLTTDNLFAMVVYKNLYPTDFEAITSGQSRLDQVHTLYREIVNESAASLERRLRELRSGQQRAQSVTEHLRAAAERLSETIDNIVHGTPGRSGAPTLMVDSTSYSLAELSEPSFWEAVGARDQSSPIQIQIPSRPALNLRRQAIENAFGRPLPQGALDDDLRPEIDTEISTLDQDREAILAAGIAELFRRRDLVMNGEHVAFSTRVRDTIQSSLAAALLEAGFLDEHFAFYVADYPAHTMSPAAAEFEMTVIERYGSDPRFRIPNPSTDVPALIESAGDDFLQDSRGYNIDLLDYLLEHAPARAETIFTSLAQGRDEDFEFIDAYLSGGGHPTDFIRALASRWELIFIYLTAAGRQPDRKTELSWLGTALANASTHIAYKTSPIATDRLETAAEDLRVLTQPGTADPAAIAAVASRLRLSFPKIAPFTHDLRAAVIVAQCFRVNRDNLRALISGTADHTPSLDELRAGDGGAEALEHILDNLGDYIAVLKQDPSARTVEDPGEFPALVTLIGEKTDLAEYDDGDAVLLFARAHPEARIESLSQVPSQTWPALVKAGRCTATVSNIHRYLEDHAGANDWWPLLRDLDSLSVGQDDDEQTKQAVALAVLAMDDLDGARRVRLVEAMSLESCIPIEELPDSAVELIPELMLAAAVEDSAETLAGIRADRQRVRDRYIAASTKLAEYIDDVDLNDADVAAVLGNGNRAAINAVLEKADVLAQVGPTTASRCIETALKTSASLTVDSLTALAGRGAPASRFALLLTRHVRNLDHAQLRPVLDAMPVPYKDLGRAQTEIPESDRGLADALASAGMVSDVRKVRMKAKVRVTP